MDQPPARSAESSVRTRLGIPPDAQRVLLFAESSHWDPNWLRTSREYFEGLVAHNLDQAVAELRLAPQRVYSIECMFFLRLFWEARPALQNELRDLLNSRRLRLTASGVTTPDTLIPSDEAILRDFLIGQEWLRSLGVTQEPDLAYFPDCFGHSPNLPALLNAAGFTRTVVGRLEGMSNYEIDLPSNFPIKGTSAELFLRREQCIDFVWRAHDGSEALCHWNAFTYGHGDQIADAGLVRIYLAPWLSRPDRSEKNVNRRIASYIRQLQPLSRTPYLFCPIGLDFNAPIPGLIELLDRYNRTVYPTSGVWLVNAGMDDYFDLIEPYRSKLPVLELDPNPYWTGFYTARPALKARTFRLWERLGLCEQLDLASAPTAPAEPAKPAGLGEPIDLAVAFWTAAVSNHHDFVTGTAPDRVAEAEQIPMLDAALDQTAKMLERFRQDGQTVVRSPAEPANPLPEIEQTQDGLTLTTAHYILKLSAAQGGQIARIEKVGEQGQGVAEQLRDGSHQMVRYNESGGLWRMGYEYRGGRFKPAALNLPPAHFMVSEQGSYLRVAWVTQLLGGSSGTWQIQVPGESLDQVMWISLHDPLVYFQVEGRAPLKSTLALCYQLPFQPVEIRTEQPGGVVTRPLQRVYTRPFWPAQHFFYLPAPSGAAGFALLLRHPGAVAVDAGGQVEVVVLRNAIREKSYLDLLPLLSHPATGIERERAAFQAALAFPRPDEEAGLPGLARSLLTAPWASSEDRLAARTPGRLVRLDSDQVFVTAIKPAWRGQGVILRLSAPAAPLGPVRVLFTFPVRQAWLCDARERDLAPLPLNGQELVVPVEKAIVTLRVLQ